LAPSAAGRAARWPPHAGVTFSESHRQGARRP
jgi:hypothetical protein